MQCSRLGTIRYDHGRRYEVASGRCFCVFAKRHFHICRTRLKTDQRLHPFQLLIHCIISGFDLPAYCVSPGGRYSAQGSRVNSYNLGVYVCIYIYTKYIYIYTCICIHIYRYIMYIYIYIYICHFGVLAELMRVLGVGAARASLRVLFLLQSIAFGRLGATRCRLELCRVELLLHIDVSRAVCKLLSTSTYARLRTRDHCSL